MNKAQLEYPYGLNEHQMDAVSHIDGPILVLAGAGTGKTKVLTTRIAHIISLGAASPNQILAVTFTNKAASEMKSRIRSFVGDVVDGMWIGTFHSIAAKILRYHASKVGLSNNFTIIDTQDQLRIAKQILRDIGIDEKQYPPKLMLYIIGRYKDKSWTPDKVPESEVGGFARGMMLQLYAEYQNRLLSLGALDFGDLLLYNVVLFNENLDVGSYYQEKFKYILVDEYQDTNVIQYLLLRILTQSNSNICCVGDDDQAIYGWRGAEVANILRFEKDFRNAKVVRLEQNYRSTSYILNCATQLISNNRSRHCKTLWTADSHGEMIKLYSFFNDKHEARFVADEIDVLHRLHKQPLSEVAILMRASYQTRNFEESLNAFRIPYRIVGGTKFYERTEIKDIIAYIRLLVNLDDGLALERAINIPKRGIGDATMQQIYETSKTHSISLFAAASNMVENQTIKGKTAAAILSFFEQLARWRSLLNNMNHTEVIDIMLDESGYKQMWKNQDTEESKERLDNIKELVNSIKEFPGLSTYLEHVSLLGDTDAIYNDDKVNVMTIHAAKGLEFSNVFLPGWEEGLFPSARTVSESGNTGIEEERRLAYVAITRAKERLYISYANTRSVYGSIQSSTPSRFLDELPSESCQDMSELLMKKKKDINNAQRTKQPINTQSGKKVEHNVFGTGIILNVYDSIAQVLFDRTGLKKVSIDYLKDCEE
ncbi:MAG: ATP-dependent helicase [Candidatus Lariskella arthropodorum]